MKRKSLYIITLSIVVCHGVFSQKSNKKHLDFNLGGGFGQTFHVPGDRDNMIPNLVIDYGITQCISLGIFNGNASSSIGYAEKYWQSPWWVSWTEQHTWNIVLTGIRGSYHFNKLVKSSKIDLYSGIMIGKTFVSHTYTTQNPYNRGAAYESAPHYGDILLYSAFVGCRYKFRGIAGFFAELGYGVTLFNFGLTCGLQLQRKKSDVAR